MSERHHELLVFSLYVAFEYDMFFYTQPTLPTFSLNFVHECGYVKMGLKIDSIGDNIDGKF